MANFNYNRITLGGRIVRPIDLKTTTKGENWTSFTIAVKRNGKGEEATDFIDCVAFRKTAELIATMFTKGASIVVDGALNIREYEKKDGTKQRNAEVVVDQFYFVDSKAEQPQTFTAPQEMPKQAQEAPAEAFTNVIGDGDLPF